jgi:RNA polymerase sigma factor (sigma-70 family)
MVKARWGNILRRVHSLLDQGILPALSDRELLERYATSTTESAEDAFAALVDRHGPMVLRVCRDVLRDEHAAPDAFQATFLVLSRRAASLWVHDSLAPWLHGVAYRTSICARAAAARRRRHERKAAELIPRDVDGVEPDDLGPILHQEIERLAERYRTPIVLCYLEGLTHDQVAERLGCPVGTVRSRLSTGRERLRRRLTARGLAPDYGLAEPATSAGPSVILVPAALAESAVRNALVHLVASATGVVPAVVDALAVSGANAMVLSRWKGAAILLLALGSGTIGVLAMGQQGPGRRESVVPEPTAPGSVARRPEGAKAVSTPGPGPSHSKERWRALAEARVETAREILRVQEVLHREGEASLEGFTEWSRRLMEARLHLAEAPAERIAAIREHRDRMLILERRLSQRVKSATVPLTEFLKGKYFRLEADELLAEAGVDPGAEASPVEPERTPKPPPAPASK